MIKRYSQDKIKELAEILRNDGIISVPTDTVYGLCGRIDSKIVHDKIMKIKGRPDEKSLPIMCANEEQIKNIAYVDEKVERLIRKFMPGPITLILNKNENLPDYITNGKDTIGVRMATSNVIEKLIKELGRPIYMTSANKSGNPTCTNLDEIEKECPLIDAMMEGDVIFSKGSTIVDCTSNQIQILRNGPISIKQVMEIVNLKE